MRKSRFKCSPLWFIAIFSASAVAENGSDEYNAKFADLLDVCIEIFLPNSMARPAGFDIEGHIGRLEKLRDMKAMEFSSEKGIDFLLEIISDAEEREVYYCAAQGLAAIAKSEER